MASYLSLDTDLSAFDPELGALDFLEEIPELVETFPNSSDRLENIVDFVRTDGGEVALHGLQAPLQQANPPARAVNPTRPARQRVRSKEVNRRNQRDYRAKKKVSSAVNPPKLTHRLQYSTTVCSSCLLCLTAGFHLLVCGMQTELQRLQAELAEMQRAMQRMQSEGKHAPLNQLVLAQRAYAQASHMRPVPHLPWQVSSALCSQQLSLHAIQM